MVVPAVVSAVFPLVLGLAVVPFSPQMLAVSLPPAIVLLNSYKVYRMPASAVALTMPGPITIFLWGDVQVHHRSAVDRSPYDDRLHVDNRRGRIVSEGDLTVNTGGELPTNRHIDVGLRVRRTSTHER